MSIVITGASRGIGAALVAEFEKLNYTVIGIARTRVEDWKVSNSPKVIKVRGDITLESDLERFVEVVRSNGPVRGIVLNAGFN